MSCVKAPEETGAEAKGARGEVERGARGGQGGAMKGLVEDHGV